MTDLIALAERCEAATGPDRELDVEIGCALDLRPDEYTSIRESVRILGIEGAAKSADNERNIWHSRLPRYTASLDAAMSLVPEGIPWVLGIAIDGHPFCNLDFERRVVAATPALALTAASLRALAVQDKI